MLQNPNTATQEDVTSCSGNVAEQCVQSAANAANENQSLHNGGESADSAPQNPPIVCCSIPQPAGTLQQSSAGAGPPRSINARDYKQLDAPEPKTACYVCGHKGSWYIEKLTPERRARAKDQQDARRVCRACYKEAVRAEQIASVPLPGTVDVSRCSRVSAEIGKCSICGMESAAWNDSERRVKLCEWCYGREVRKE